MGLFNSVSKLTQKVISKFKNTGYNEKKVHVSSANNPSQKGMAKSFIIRKGFRKNKEQPKMSNRQKRIKNNPVSKYWFGNFSPVKY
jgi:hypothetical protein